MRFATTFGISLLSLAACSGDNFAMQVSVGGRVSGLAGSGLLLQGPDGEHLDVTGNGTFAFETKLAPGAAYDVTILAQPSSPTQVCTISRASGTASTLGVSDISVSCSTSEFALSGSVTGLAGSGLMLRNGSDELAIAADGGFTFEHSMSSGKMFAIEVAKQPHDPSQTCAVLGGAGTIGAGPVSSILVNCSTDRFAVGGDVTGLAGTLRLGNSNGDEVTLTAIGTFAFPMTIASGGSYEVTILEQPTTPSQTCSLAGASGAITDANISSVHVECVTNKFTVGGQLSGLAGTGLILLNNGDDDLAPAADGSFQFATAVASGADYAVTVGTQPSGPTQLCAVTNGSGKIGGQAVTDVEIACTTQQFAVGGTLSGMIAGTTIVLRNNGGDDITMTADGTFKFATPVASGAAYAVTIATQPASQICTVASGSGTIGAGDVGDVSVTCIFDDMLMDTAPAPTNFTDKRCNGAISLAIESTEAVTVTRLDAQLEPLTATNVRFAIFDKATSTLLFYSPSVAVAPGLQFVRSPDFSFAMTAGTRYHFAAMVEGCANFPWDFTGASENGLTTFRKNGNPTNFAAPAGPNECCGVDPRFQIHGHRP